MKYLAFILSLGFILLLSGMSIPSGDDWGFFAHRKINRLAVFTCPPDLIGFYKQHIDYLSDHAVDPDMRRHASKYEAIRHYIDIDHWGEFPFNDVPRSYPEAIIKYGTFTMDINGSSLTSRAIEREDLLVFTDGNLKIEVESDSFIKFFKDTLFFKRYDETFQREFDEEIEIIPGLRRISVIDSFSAYGIIPFSLLESHYRLVRAFEAENVPLILKISADYGHYIADAHVPLHTTENYNGQLTGQDGIHAFWESRIPELFAEKEFDFFVGKAEYIPDLNQYFWDIVLDSHAEVDEVLGEEMRLRNEFPVDQQFCYDERNGLTVRIQCPEFAKAYQNAMGDMVQQRFREAVRSIGSLWYTAWVQAGRPSLSGTNPEYISERYDTMRVNGRLLGREHR